MAELQLTTSCRFSLVAGFTRYRVSDSGRIQGLRGSRWRDIKPFPRGRGHLAVDLREGDRRRRCYIHTLVLETFLGPRPSDDHVARHIDGDRTNNVVSNLRWGIKQENIFDAISHGVHGTTKLTPESAAEIYQSEESTVSLARKHGVSERAIKAIRSHESWLWAIQRAGLVSGESVAREQRRRVARMVASRWDGESLEEFIESVVKAIDAPG